MTRPSEGKLIDGRYRCLQRLGSGGMADVWLCEDSQLDRRVAIKILHEQYARDGDFVERFRREAAAMAGVQHPNVVGIFDRGEFEGTPYIAMEFVEGPTLRRLIDDGLSVAEAVEICGQLLAGVRFAHERGIVHRDLKPGNVLVDRDGRARIADFGIAHAGVSEITQTGSVMGTAEYLSPEQAQGHPVTPASDLYSVGVILYEMLTGRVPFEGDNAVAVAMKHVTERPLAPSARNANVSGALDQVVLKALSKEPANRYQRAEDFTAALNAAAHGREPMRDTAVQMAPVPPPVTAEHALAVPPRRWPWAVLATLVLAAVIVFAVLAGSPGKAIVPSVLKNGTTEEQAIRILERDGFEVETERVERSEAAGTVVDQDPQAGTEADEGSTVTIFVSVGPGSETVPRVGGMPRDEAVDALEKAGFDVNLKERFSRSTRAGLAIGTKPAAGTSFERGRTVVLFISKGVPKVAVPLVVGREQREAIEILQDAGFIVDLETVTGDEPAGTVIDQDPVDGTERPRRSKVTITVSNGRGTVIVADVTGLRERRATRALSRQDLAVEVSYEAVTDPAQDGIVIAQSPTGSTRVPAGTTVTITVGDFEPPPEDPGEGTP